MKRSNKVLILMMVGSLAFAGFATADHRPGHKPRGGGGSGEEGITPAIITFRDAVGDRIGSDCSGGGNCPYEHEVNGVEAFIGSKANYGNIWLRTQLNRDLYVNFEACESNNCDPPFSFANQSPASIKVDADNVIQDGIYGMSAGDSVHVPMRVYLGNPDWFVDFNPDLKAMNKECNQSTKVKVTRLAADTWVISGGEDVDPESGKVDDIGCLTPTGTKGYLGRFHMPFSMIVQIKQ